MPEPVVFRKEDWSNLEFVRQIVLRRLREDSSWHQFDFIWDENQQAHVQFEPRDLRPRFLELANEVHVATCHSGRYHTRPKRLKPESSVLSNYRHLLELDYVPAGVSGDAQGPDNIVFDIGPAGSAGGFGHPHCGSDAQNESNIAGALPPARA